VNIEIILRQWVLVKNKNMQSEVMWSNNIFVWTWHGLISTNNATTVQAIFNVETQTARFDTRMLKNIFTTSNTTANKRYNPKYLLKSSMSSTANEASWSGEGGTEESASKKQGSVCTRNMSSPV
jgi:hypothetical protein